MLVKPHAATTQYRENPVSDFFAGLDLIWTASGEQVFRGTAFQTKHAHELLDRNGKVDWQRTPGFVWDSWNASMTEPFTEDLIITTVVAGEVPTPPDPLSRIAPPSFPEARQALAPRHVAPSASTFVPWSQREPEEIVPKASASSCTSLVILIDTRPFCRPFWLLTVKAETPARMVTLKRANDTASDYSAARQLAVLSLQAFCRLDGVPPSRTVLGATAQAQEWLAAIAHLGRVKAQ